MVDMAQGLDLCKICNRQVLDNGQCLYCTTNEALDLKGFAPDATLEPPPADKIITLVEISSGRTFRLDSARSRIGRDPKAHIVIDDVYTSRHHAFITYEEGQYWIEDLGSKNGSRLNGAHILEREVLTLGDTLTIGHTDFRVE